MTDVTIKIGGQAGQGMQSISYILGKLFTRGGYYVFTSQDIMSRIRGGHNFSQIRVKSEPVYCNSELVNVLIALDEETVNLHQNEMVENGVIIYDKEKGKFEGPGISFFPIPLEKLAKDYGKDKIMVNAVALGALMHLTGYPVDLLYNVLKEEFGAKGMEIVNRNLASARAGYDYARGQFRRECPCKIGLKSKGQKRMLISGSEVIGLTAILSGLKFYAGYPMSPSTPIMEYIASKEKDFNIVVEQAEDEISAINMIIGAAFTGVRSMTATSGGGFALMVEGISLAGMTETPVVIVVSQRPGPATGFPTRTEQGDLLFTIHAGHGEFPRAVFAPGTPEQAFLLVNKAFNLADKYQVPVIILTDQHFNDSFWTVDSFDLAEISIERYEVTNKWLNQRAYTYKRYNLTDSGISPRIYPGLRNQVIYADSDEHTEEGHITESAEIRNKMVEKRLKKLEAIRMELSSCQVYPRDNQDIMLITFGSTFGAAKEAIDILQKQGMKIGMLHLSEVYPFPRESVLAHLSFSQKIFTLENNATGQLARLLTTETRLKVLDKILKYDGRPFSAPEIVRRVEMTI
ncbi:MAG: 2-oxoacid:acceptor oxidoreductase subunit alpha [candidate division WOR-3 bacterium]|nr:2-oxoacid:acceptor oxidoreductase subunit alpha [candidate division WOR-3 bacterium]MDH5684216.1 2-oxoacid:acceptor oxidoreductase subunit alpha [candidate division WOR-3 bacterium]